MCVALLAVAVREAVCSVGQWLHPTNNAGVGSGGAGQVGHSRADNARLGERTVQQHLHSNVPFLQTGSDGCR